MKSGRALSAPVSLCLLSKNRVVVAQAQVRRMLEVAIDRLPQAFRTVFVLRDIEGLSIEETATALDVLPATVKTRHLRARRRLRKALEPELKSALTGSFPFAGADCEAMTARIVAVFAQPKLIHPSGENESGAMTPRDNNEHCA